MSYERKGTIMKNILDTKNGRGQDHEEGGRKSYLVSLMNAFQIYFPTKNHQSIIKIANQSFFFLNNNFLVKTL